MTDQFKIKKKLYKYGHHFSSESWANATIMLDLSPNITSVEESVTKQLRPIMIPRTKSRWQTSSPETRFYDFKRMTLQLKVEGSISGSVTGTINGSSATFSALDVKNILIAMMEAGGTLTSLKWRNEVFTRNASEVGSGEKRVDQNAFISDIRFVDKITEGSGNLMTQEVAYDFTMTIKIGEER